MNLIYLIIALCALLNVLGFAVASWLALGIFTAGIVLIKTLAVVAEVHYRMMDLNDEY